jgi:2-(1,2-epoxy-1,2-dihydrophenyl)acetyl-CoA isomerase
MPEPEVLYRVEEHIATITLNAAERLNALSEPMLRSLADAAARAQEDPAARAVILTGAGRAFCAGGDMKTMARAAEDAPPGQPGTVAFVQRAQLALRRLAKPLVAAVNGPAYGAGLDLACAADFRVAARSARFCEVYVRLGLAPGGGGFWLLPRIVGLTHALELVLSGETIDADHALRIGLVSEVVDDAALPAAARTFAGRFARAAPLGVQVAKRALYHGLDMSFDAALEMIRPHVAELRRTADHREGLAAAREKREPRFQGR